jgi:PBP1b-binding outer membrane lipoprotein LpoB
MRAGVLTVLAGLLCVFLAGCPQPMSPTKTEKGTQKETTSQPTKQTDGVKPPNPDPG